MSPKPWLPLALLAFGCGQSDVPTVTQTTLDSAISYGDSSQQVLDLFPVKTKGPLVVFVHGGAWQSGSRNEFRAISLALQAKGIAAATADYRLSPAVQHPAHARDVAQALSSLINHAERHGFDPKRVFVVGHSAGAHIAATIATDPKLLALVQPAGFVGLEGIYDVPKLATRFPTYKDWFLKRAFGEEDKWVAGSPTRAKLVSKVPWLLVHSKADELVDMPQTEEFGKHLRDAGVKVKVLTPEGKSHGGVVTDLANENDEVAKAILEFVQKPR